MKNKEVDLHDFPSDFSEIPTENGEIPEEFVDFYSRLADRLGTSTLANALASWITNNTFLAGNPFSFKDHEFQIDIANDVHPDVVVQKCSQVGLSELSVRISLAILGVSNGRSLIYVLPSAKFASEFTKARIDPVIETSAKLSGMLVSAANSSLMKRIGNSILYVGGAANQKQAISRPADALVVDEYDFCNMTVMTTYASRLRHALNPYKRKFSTPTVDDFGVAGEYKKSTQLRYFVKCDRCGCNQAPDFNTQVRIPGWKGEDFKNFDKEDLFDAKIRIDDAYIACVKCKKPLEPALNTPSRREWVAKFQGRALQGYAVKPFDLPRYNTTPSIIRQLGDYSREQDYWNFVQGEVHASNENQVNIEIVKRCFTLMPQTAGDGMYMGVDVGKTCHVMIGKPMPGGKVDVVACIRVRAKDGPLFDQLKAIYEAFGCWRAVIDAGPDYTLGKALHDEFGEYFHQCIYIKGSEKDLTYMRHDEDTNVISVLRTKGFDALVKELNSGKWSFCKGEEEEEVLEHFKGMKRVEEINDVGERVSKWAKVNNFDHFLHSAMYLKTAIDFDMEPIEDGESVVASYPMIVGAGVGKKFVQGHQESVRDLVRQFGVR